MSYFMNTGCFVSEEFKNQTNFSYFLNEEVLFSRKNCIISDQHVFVKKNVKNLYINTDLNTNASPYYSPKEQSFDFNETFLDFNEIYNSLKIKNKPPKISPKISPKTSPKIKIFYRKK